MTNGEVTWFANFIGGVADGVLGDLYIGGKLRDDVLPMRVLRRLDAVLGPTKTEVLAIKESLDGPGIVNEKAVLKAIAKQPFCNTRSPPAPPQDQRFRQSRYGLRARGARAALERRFGREGDPQDTQNSPDGVGPTWRQPSDELP